MTSDLRFHSVFSCPILRQTATDANPPLRLICGHVISKDALAKLATGSKYVFTRCYRPFLGHVVIFSISRTHSSYRVPLCYGCSHAVSQIAVRCVLM